MLARVSVLDQSPVPEGAVGGDALRNTLDLARLADELGFHRLWLAEHHGGPTLAGTSPEVLLGPVGAATSRIRIGSGGVMLPHYSPLKVAETFAVLANLFPGRVDLGVGRAAGTDPRTAHALQRDRRQAAPDDFREQLGELLTRLDHELLPPGPERPVPWLLGSSPQSAIWAAELGLPYAFADFINPQGAGITELYRERFEPSERLAHPRVAVTAWALAADDAAEAAHLATSSRMVFTLLRQGRLIQVPPPEKAARFLAARGSTPGPSRRAITGSPAEVRAGLEALAGDYGAEEAIVVTITFDHAARRRSYELLADAFGLERATPAEAAVA